MTTTHPATTVRPVDAALLDGYAERETAIAAGRPRHRRGDRPDVEIPASRLIPPRAPRPTWLVWIPAPRHAEPAGCLPGAHVRRPDGCVCAFADDQPEVTQ